MYLMPDPALSTLIFHPQRKARAIQLHSFESGIFTSGHPPCIFVDLG